MHERKGGGVSLLSWAAEKYYPGEERSKRLRKCVDAVQGVKP